LKTEIRALKVQKAKKKRENENPIGKLKEEATFKLDKYAH